MSSQNTYSLAEVKKHNTPSDLWVVIHNKVYDLTKFAQEHPGGNKVLEEQGGDYATEPFEDVGHSEDAREMMEAYLLGDLNPKTLTSHTGLNANNWTGILIPIGAILLAAISYKYFY